MSQQTVVLEVAGDPRLARDLAAGGVFVPGCTLQLNEECQLVVRAANGELTVSAKCVWVDGNGAGLQLAIDADMKRQLAELAAAPAATAESETPAEETVEEEDDPKKVSGSVHERMRGLTLVQQIKVAHSSVVQDRVILERLYGKNVWEALLRNPHLTGPEVARIARMGSLPRTLIEIIVGNGAWLQIPEVRRALLSNPRLGTDQVLRILRLLPKHELKLAGMQSAYPMQVRDAAKRMIKEAGG